MNQDDNNPQLSKDQIDELLSSLTASLPVPLEEMPPPFRQLLDSTVNSARQGDLEPLMNLPELMMQLLDDEDDGEPLTSQDAFPLSSPAAANILDEGDVDDEADPDALIDVATRALAEDPSSVEAWVCLGKQSAEPAQKLKCYRRACDAVANKDPDDVSFAMPMNRMQMAIDLHSEGNWVDAATILLPALQESPTDQCETRYFLAELLLLLGWDDELEEICKAFGEDSFGPIPFAVALLMFKSDGDSRHANALLKCAHEQQPGVVDAVRHPPKFDSNGEMTDAEFVAQCLLPGLRGIPGATAWIREATDSGHRESARDDDLFADDETQDMNRDPLGFVIELKPSDEQWFLVVTKLDEAFAAVVLTDEMVLVQADTFEDRPKTAQLQALLRSAITDPITGRRRKPNTLFVATKTLVSALRRHCGTFNIDLKQQKLPTEMSRVIKTLMEGYLRQIQGTEGTDQDAMESIESLDVCDETWLFAIFQPPMWIHDRATPWRPWMYMVQRASDGVILATESSEEKPTVQSAAQILGAAMAHPLVDQPRRPEEILCDPTLPIPLSEVANSLGLEDTAIQLGAETLPDFFNSVIADMLAFNAPVQGALIQQDGVDKNFLASLYAEAARFYQAAPWKMVPGDRIFEISCDAWDNPRWGGCVVGQLGQELGLALYDSPDAANEFTTSQDTSMMNALMIHFGEAFDTIPQDQWYLERNGWKVASEEAYPFISRIVKGSDLICPSAADLTALHETMRHTTRFLDHPPSEPLVAKTTNGEKIRFRWLR